MDSTKEQTAAWQHERSLVPTDEQESAKHTIAKFLAKPVTGDQRTKLCTISGAAGTGKTTLLGMVRNMVEHSVISAPTNKAVLMLRQRGFTQATTVDRVINKKVYTPIRRPMTPPEIAFYNEHQMPLVEYIEEEEYEAIDNEDGGLVVIVDEASMTDTDMIARLLMLYNKVIAVGDGFQLPPVEGEAWFQDYHYDVTLTIPARAAATSEITRLANMVRAKNPAWHKGWTNEVTVITNWRKAEYVAALNAVRDADLVIAHKNVTCDIWNPMIREERELVAIDDPTRPVKGDRLLAWQKDTSNKICKSERYQVIAANPRQGGYYVRILNDNGAVAVLPVNKATLQEQKSSIKVEGLQHFSFGHCVTCHKSQGGEWDRVVVIAGDKAKNHDDYWNWLYTAVSRAKTHLTVLL